MAGPGEGVAVVEAANMKSTVAAQFALKLARVSRLQGPKSRRFLERLSRQAPISGFGKEAENQGHGLSWKKA
jgi:hypothetical protein